MNIEYDQRIKHGGEDTITLSLLAFTDCRP